MTTCPAIESQYTASSSIHNTHGISPDTAPTLPLVSVNVVSPASKLAPSTALVISSGWREARYESHG